MPETVSQRPVCIGRPMLKRKRFATRVRNEYSLTYAKQRIAGAKSMRAKRPCSNDTRLGYLSVYTRFSVSVKIHDGI